MLELPRPGAMIAERYRVEASLGRGAMGSVWAVLDERTGRSVALKLIHTELAESADAVTRFLNEARIASRIEHPNVVTIFDLGRVGQTPFLVMERLRGESLAQRIARGRVPAREVIEIVIEVCKGVREAHREGVIHRDLKPANIFLAGEGQRVIPKVLDFGVAKLSTGVGVSSITRTGSVLGTPAYLAPEHIGAARDADVRGDVYSIGVVLYEAITRHLPYDADDLVVLVRKIAEGGAPHLRAHAPDVPSGLDAVVRRAMSADRERRHANMDELIADLERFRPVRARPAPATDVRPPPMVSVPPRPRSLAPWIVLFAAASMFVLALFGGVLGEDHGAQAQEPGGLLVHQITSL
jgi:serine/threonine protein kinase